MRKYPEYKDSGVEWIDKIPNDWILSRIKRVAKIIGRIGFRGYTVSDIVPKNKGAVSLSPSNINDHQLQLKDCTYLSWEKYEESPEIKIYANDIVLVKTGSTIGKTALIPNEHPKMTLNPQLVVLKEIKLDPKFLYFVMISSYFQYSFNVYSAGGSTPAISQEKLNNFIFIFPEKTEEQRIIANYLDRKTSQIDTLISKKQKLIELLKEERSAMINQAVTNGLHPDVPMKDSGIEWLGEIPEHWEVKKLKYLVKIRYGLGQPPKQKDGGLPIIRATNVYRGIISDKNLVFVDPEDLPMDRNPILKTNDIIIVRSGAYTGDSAIITDEWAGAVTGYDMVITPQRVSPKLLSYSLLTTYMLNNQLFILRLRAAQPHLNAEEIGETIMIVPMPEEQLRIVSFIEKEDSRIKLIVDKVTSEIELLKEYKTALISEVVTGKADVRKEVLI